MKYRIDESLCVGCGLCVNVCPVRAITMAADTAKINIDSCTGCSTCAGVCKKGAIIEVPDPDKPVQGTVSVPAAIATAIGAVGDAVKRYASSSSPTGSRRGGGMGRGGGRGMNRQNKRRR